MVKLVQGLEIYSSDWMPTEFHKNLKSYLGMPERMNELFIKLKGIPSLCEIPKDWVSHGIKRKQQYKGFFKRNSKYEIYLEI